MKKSTFLFMLLITTFYTVSAQKKLAGAWRAVKLVVIPNSLELDLENDEFNMDGFKSNMQSATDSTSPQVKKTPTDSLKQVLRDGLRGLVLIFEKNGTCYHQTNTSFTKGTYTAGNADEAASYRLEFKDGNVLTTYSVSPVEGSEDKISFTAVKQLVDYGEYQEEFSDMRYGFGSTTIIFIRVSDREEKKLKKGMEAHQKKVEQLAKEKAAKAEQ